jgi:hypothetical protein
MYSWSEAGIHRDERKKSRVGAESLGPHFPLSVLLGSTSMAQTDTQSSCALDAFTKLKDQLSNVLASVHAYQHPVSKPPIIDACFEDRIDDVHRVDSVPGLRFFKESVRKDLDILSTVK